METTTSDAHAVNENGMGLTCLWSPWRVCGEPEYRSGRNIAHAFFIKTFVDFMKTIETEWLEKIAEKDLRFLDNKEWLEEMNSKFKVGHPSIIWAEAMMLAEAMWNTYLGKDIVFIRWGLGMKEKKLYVVRKMAIYLLENPTDFRRHTELAELDKMNEVVNEQERKINGGNVENQGNKDYIFYNDIVDCRAA